MHHLIILSIFVLFNSLLLSTVEAERNSFSIDLIHRDSILSPLHSSSNTLQKNDVSQLNSSLYVDAKFVESDMSHSNSGYLIKIHISKTYEVLAIASLTSDLIWIQCAPCDECYPQDKPFFEPSESTTYEQVLSGSKTCKDFGHLQDGRDDEYCWYSYKSGEEKFTSGVLSTETFYLSSESDRHPFEKKVFGCGTQNLMKVPTTVQGVIGLGRGEFSLVSQLRSKLGEKFSYCLRKSHRDTKLRFGTQPPINNLAATLKLFPRPADLDQLSNSMYVLKLKAIGVEDKKIQVSEQDGYVVLDIGKSLTYLHGRLYNELIENFEKVIGRKMKPVEDSIKKYKMLCYKKEDFLFSAIPEMVFSFSGASLPSGSDLILTPSHTFGNSGQNICMMIIRSSKDYSILGSAAQKNFRVEYEREKVTFTKADCEVHNF